MRFDSTDHPTSDSEPLAPAAPRPRRRAEEAFRRRFSREPRWLVRAPGRVNLLGAHVDYSEGWVLAGAVDRAVWIAAAPAEAGQSSVVAVDFDDETELDPRHLPPPVPERDTRATSWADLPRGVQWALGGAGLATPPIDAAFSSDVPIGAGLSSSAAVETGFLLLWEEAAGWAIDEVAKARLGQRVENGYLGVGSGIMDQFVSLHGRANHLLLLDCRDLSFEPVPLPADLSILIADTGVRRELAGSSYNQRPEECRTAVELLKPYLPKIRTLRDVTGAELERHVEFLPEPFLSRARHVVAECVRVRSGADALLQGDVQKLGEMMNDSHASSRDLYQVSIPELDTLAEAARSSDGCLGARLVGAGMGGCVAALIRSRSAIAVEHAMRDAFSESFGRTPETYTVEISDGAGVIRTIAAG